MSKPAKQWGIPLAVCLGCGFFLLVTYLGWQAKPQRIESLMLLTVGCLTPYFLTRRSTGDTTARWVRVILCAGLVMRVGYALYTPSTLRAHDLGPIELGTSGHAGYILHLFTYGALPVDNAVQFSQPPFFHLLGAGVMHVYSLLSGITNAADLFDSVRLVSCLASCATLFVCLALGRDLGLRGKALLCYLCLCAFLPQQILLAGRVNPDSLSVFFLFMILLLALRWYRQPSVANAVGLGLCFGLGMMTKMTVAVMALPVGALMSVVLWKQCVRQRHWRALGQVALFLLICAPLGLWHPIRNAILFGQPLGGIYTLLPTNVLYVGNLPVAERFGLFAPGRLFAPLYVTQDGPNNVWLYMIKTAVFGEFTYGVDVLVPLLLLASFLALLAGSLAALCVGGIAAMKTRSVRWIFLGLAFLAVLLSFAWFNVRYPFRCSMDYRYVVPLFPLGALALGKAMQRLKSGTRLAAVGSGMVVAVVALFSVCAVVMFTMV